MNHCLIGADMLQYFLVSLFLFSSGFTSGYALDEFVLNQLVFRIRDPKTQAAEFRSCLEKIGEYLATDLYGELEQKNVSIETLTGSTVTHRLCVEKPVLITILRAGVPLYLGVQKVFPDSDAGFLGVMRDEHTLEPKVHYIAIPDLKDKTVIVIDTMLATGGSMVDAIKVLEKYHPKKIHVVCAIAAEKGLAKVSSHYPLIKITAAAVDPILNERGYIMPGLGDAGDRSYGKKL